ncbi:metal ABC transporter solute-binding protein, Zn/Mn family [Rothia uropygioeca]|uniref:metal ABC transporter solute-binding protein, Zn/Mn family n=1 Tax=Kocuria sp. 257 TaxID=2021970 RepID=UPI001012ABAF|nr:zinc ABC transporter substrate-binding protein [Kocuria sp. 257]
MRGKGWVRAVAIAAIGGVALTGCSNSDSGSSGRSENDKITVVTSTNVYSDIVKSIAGDNVKVEPIINSTSQDPHSYEATAQDRLKAKDADLIVENGGGYDAFMEDISEGSDAKKIDAVELSGLPGAGEAGGHDHDHDSDSGHEHDHDHGSFNEHVWYNPKVMETVSKKISDELGSLDSDHKDDYSKREQELGDKLGKLQERASSLKGDGRQYLATEPVPGYLLQAAGLKDATPQDFYEAIEGDTDAPASVIKSLKDELDSGNIALLGFNSQTESSQTQDVKKYAEDHNVSTVSFTETLPDDQDYVGWMNMNLDNISSALDSQS